MTEENQAPNSNERSYRWIEKHPLLTILFAVVIIFVMVVIYWAIWANSSPVWTGFGAYDEETAGPRAKTLWDWLGLLIVPLAVAIGAAVISYFQKRTELEIAKKARETEQKIATDRQMQATLEAYYDRMTELLLEHGLRESKVDSNVRSIARTRTIAVMRSLDNERNIQLFAFLMESNLIEISSPIVILAGANFSGLNLNRVNLIWVNLNGINLSRAQLTESFLSSIDLSEADLSEADLRGTSLSETNLSWACLSDTILLGVDLSNANLKEANLRGAKLSGANLWRANLSGCDFRRTDLRLTRNWTIEQFDQVNRLESAIMPDGTKLGSPGYKGPTYEEWKDQYLAKQSSG